MSRKKLLYYIEKLEAQVSNDRKSIEYLTDLITKLQIRLGERKEEKL